MNDSTIVSIVARRIWDSRGRPTIEVDMRLADGSQGRGIAPAGASRGAREAVDLRDGGQRLSGFGVQQALAGISSEIAPALLGMDARDQIALDRRLIELDGTPTKARLGGNALVAVSLAALHAAAASVQLPLWTYVAQGQPVSLPLPEVQIFGGGVHAGGRIDIQDLMVIPVSARSFAEALEMSAEVYLAAGQLMAGSGRRQGVADEGGYWPAFASNEEALDMLVRAIKRAGYVPGQEMAISLDIAASEFGADGRYWLGLDRLELDSDAMCELLIRWCERYPILSIEDPLAEDDADGLQRFTAAVGQRVQVIGDDYLVTNAARVEAAARERSVNAVLIKLNQAGTVTETVAALQAGKRAGFGTIVSARSGETEDTTIAHLAVGWNAGQLKVGSFSRSERMAKWNEVLRIEQALGPHAKFSGTAALPIGRSKSATGP
jgi:enolase